MAQYRAAPRNSDPAIADPVVRRRIQALEEKVFALQKDRDAMREKVYRLDAVLVETVRTLQTVCNNNRLPRKG